MKLKINIPLEIDLLELKNDIGVALLNNDEVIKYIKNEIYKSNLENASFEIKGESGNKGSLASILNKFNEI